MNEWSGEWRHGSVADTAAVGQLISGGAGVYFPACANEAQENLHAEWPARRSRNVVAVVFSGDVMPANVPLMLKWAMVAPTLRATAHGLMARPGEAGKPGAARESHAAMVTSCTRQTLGEALASRPHRGRPAC